LPAAQNLLLGILPENRYKTYDRLRTMVIKTMNIVNIHRRRFVESFIRFIHRIGLRRPRSHGPFVV
jgi:hypothetical protein